MATLLCLWLLLAVLAGANGRPTCDQIPPDHYEIAGGPKEGILNVHLVPHTHDDVGWLKTVDQYFIGSNSSIQHASVQYILDSVVSNLAENGHRRFIYVEQAFFQRWWRQQSEEKQSLVKRLVKDGQLEFINGGWCMHDEASTHYVDMVDQTTLGHRFIKRQFQKVPTIGWQIDPFGHSAAQASLLSAEAGFDGLFFGRADWVDIAQRRIKKEMEMIWRGSKSLGSSADVFTGILGNHYDAPVGYNFDTYWTSDPIQDDCRLYDMNVEERVNTFIEDNQKQASQFKTNHIMLTMGADFTYSNAHVWYKNMDKIIHYVNKDGRVNAFYSTPSIYLHAKHKAKETWPLKENDFFPYSDCKHCFWTGYFTSRPALKGYVRQLSGYLQAARQLESLVGRSEEGANTDTLEEAVAINQHHDAVSGTEKQHVANDYAKRLSIGAAEAEEVINFALKTLTEGHVSQKDVFWETATSARFQARALLERKPKPVVDKSGHKFQQCQLLNISYCPPTETELSEDQTLVVMAYNPLAWTRTEMIRIPVASQNLLVTTTGDKPVPSQVSPLSHVTLNLRKKHTADVSKGNADVSKENADVSKGAEYELAFLATTPPLGFTTYFVKRAPPGTNGLADVASITEVPSSNGPFKVANEEISLTFSPETGRLINFENYKSKVSLDVVEQTMLWYNASDGNVKEDEDPGQASGAYLFRPNSSEAYPMPKSANRQPQLTLVQGPLLTEVRQEFSPWAQQVFRLFKGAEDAQVEYTVGPIPIEDGLGKEVITRLTTKAKNGKTFYTDSNGRDLVKRVVNERDSWNLTVYEPVAGNYYPVNSAILLKDSEVQVTLLTDRSLGGTALEEGQLELMLHRRLLEDDWRGVGEPLNETTCTGKDHSDCQGLVVRGVFHVGVADVAAAPRWHKVKAQKLYNPLHLVFSVKESGGPKGWLESHRGDYSAVEEHYELPKSVALMTLQELEGGATLVRLAHLFEVEEHDELSKLARVDLKKLFGGRRIDDVKELSLTANQRKSEMKRLKWRIEGDRQNTAPPLRGKSLANGDRVVELGPMEIRTFELRFGN